MSLPSITSSSIQKLTFFRHFNVASNIYHNPNYNFLLNRVVKYGSCPQDDIVVVVANTTHCNTSGYHCTLPKMVVSPT